MVWAPCLHPPPFTSLRREAAETATPKPTAKAGDTSRGFDLVGHPSGDPPPPCYAQGRINRARYALVRSTAHLRAHNNAKPYHLRRYGGMTLKRKGPPKGGPFPLHNP